MCYIICTVPDLCRDDPNNTSIFLSLVLMIACMTTFCITDRGCASCDVHLYQAQESMGEKHEGTIQIQKEAQEARQEENYRVQWE